MSERGGGLVDIAKRDLLAEESRSLDHIREDHSDLTDHEVESLELQAPEHDRPGVGDHCCKAGHEAGVLDLLASIERNVLGIVADAHQGVAVRGCQQLIEKVQPNERPPDPEGKNGRDDHVDVRKEDHRSRNLLSKDGDRT